MNTGAHSSATEAALAAAGVVDAAELLARFAKEWPAAAPPPEVVDALTAAADPALAVASFARLRESVPEAVAAVLTDAQAAARLITLAGASPLIGRLLLADQSCWSAALGLGSEAEKQDTAVIVPPPQLPEAPPFEELARALRLFKRRRLLLIAARDLLGGASLEDTTAALTTLAEDALETAIVALRARLALEYGEVRDGRRPLGFTVFGMGKLGGHELNFSSDIDLIYLYEGDGIESGGGPRGRLSAREFFTRLAEDLTRALHQATDEGFVFRVDLRLRPEGRNGPIVNSLANAISYYEAWGQTWERAAYLKARPVAGDRVLGETFLSELKPFVYRSYLDYGTIEDLKHMKARVESAPTVARGKGTNVKLAHGGIREIEFVIQSLQLVHAGKDERIRERNSLGALALLAEARYLAREEANRLTEAYRFLRDVEHKIQLVEELQTHVIPTGEGELHLARRLGYVCHDPSSALERFREDRRRHMGEVHASFTALFHSPRESISRAADRGLSDLLGEVDEEGEAATKLGALGFRDPKGSVAHLRLLRDGAPNSRATPRRKKLLREVGPALLDQITRAPDPDLALRNMASFLAAIGARSSFLALLAENPKTLSVLVRLFGSSEFLSHLLIRHPEMLDSLVRADLVRVEVPKSEIAAELASVLASAETYEDQLDALRRVRNEHFLRIGINDLEDLLASPAVSSQLSDLADACLEAVWKVAEREALERHRLTEPPGRFAVVAMGKLGGRELTYNSDLDLIFIYAPGAEPTAAMAREYFTRLGQRMLTTLQVQTREGRLYRIDTRLRPSGNAGPLVSSLAAFARYHAESSQLWERQALIKARGVAGDPALVAEVENIIDRFVYAAPLREDEVGEINRLRMRMERELAGDEREGFNIKTGPGGLVDIEFATQMLQLRHGTTTPSVRKRATRHALGALAEAGALPVEDATVLLEGYAFLRALSSRLRIERDQPVEALEREGERLPALARRLGYEGPEAVIARRLLDDYAHHRESVRSVYARLFGID